MPVAVDACGCQVEELDIDAGLLQKGNGAVVVCGVVGSLRAEEHDGNLCEVDELLGGLGLANTFGQIDGGWGGFVRLKS